jgi:capsular exopolysaccharide synthesis family protein
VTIHSNGNNLAVVESAPALATTKPAGPYGGGGAGGAGGGRVDSDSILEIVWRQRGVVGIATAVALALAVLYLLVATRYYSGYAKLYVRQVGPQVLNEDQHQWQDSDAFLYTQREVMSSTPVVAMALGAPGIRELKTFDAQENTFTYFKKNLSIEVGKKDELLSVQFDTPFREDAQKIVGALVDAYTNFQSKTRNNTATEVLSVLQQQRDKQVAELRRKQEELQQFRATNGVYSGTDERTNVAKQRLESLSTALTQAQTERIGAKSAWDDVQRAILGTPARKQKFELARDNVAGYAPSALDDAALRTQMLGLQAQLQDLLGSGRYGPRHPTILRIQDMIDGLNVTYAVAVFRRWETSKQREADLQAEFDEQQKLAIQHNARAVEDATLQRSIDGLTASVGELEKKIRDVAVTQGGGAPAITVIEPPSASKAPSRPYVWQTLGLALLGGLVVGCVGGCVRDWYDYRLRNADEIKAALGVTVLGLIPRVNDETSPIARGQKIHIDPTSDVAEAYRSLRTAIYFGSKEHPARTILVTSPERGDGKTTSASNLAISLAQAGRRTLLVDADLRAPMQDLIFGINGRTGLASVLAGKETIDNAVRHTGIENLDLLPAGVAARNPSELLNSPKFIEVLDQLIEKYDQVIIDSPPMLAVTDARIIAASADATVLVLRAGKSNRKLGELSIDGLFSVGAKVLGAVVNDIQRRSYRYYGSYGRYGYGNNGRTDRSQAYVPAGTNGNGNGHEMYAVHVNSDEEELAARSRLTSG